MFKNAGDAVHGPVALRKALSVSSDVFFYRLGQEANGKGNGLLIQDWARKLGLGRRTGIDLPGENPGLIPTPKYRNEGFASFQKCKAREKPTPEQISLGKCGFLDRPWSVGDNVNLSVGQGDLQADPLQMAVAYAAIANGGRVIGPRLGQRIEDATGRPLQELEAPPARKLNIKPEFRQAIMDGLRSAASEPGGTSDARVQGLQDPHRRQDRHRREGRRPPGPVVVRGPGALPRPQVRGGRDLRAGRLRRRHRGPRGAQDPGPAVRGQGGGPDPGRGCPGLMAPATNRLAL